MRRPRPRPAAPQQLEPPQDQGSTLPTVERCSPTVVKCVDGLRGVVSRWECSATRLGALASFTRLSGAAVAAHPRTVDRHREAVETWLRERP